MFAKRCTVDILLSIISIRSIRSIRNKDCRPAITLGPDACSAEFKFRFQEINRQSQLPNGASEFWHQANQDSASDEKG